MKLEEVSINASHIVFLFSLSISPVVMVWFGMMLLPPTGLAGLTEERIQRMARLRRGFSRLIFRSLLWFVILIPIMGLIALLTFAKAISTLAIGVVLLLLFSIWWLYVVVGSLVYAWIALDILVEGESQ